MNRVVYAEDTESCDMSRMKLELLVVRAREGWQSRTLHLHAVPAVNAQYVRISGIAKESRSPNVV